MARPRTLLPLVLALLALVAAPPTAPAAPSPLEPLYLPAPHGPYDVGKAPTAVLADNFDAAGRASKRTC